MAPTAGRGREPQTDMQAEEVVELVDCLERAGIAVWLDGGWGVDALVGEQTRDHDDLDLVARLDDVSALQDALARRGYALAGGEAPMSFELTDGVGRQVDVHPVAFTNAGDGVYRMRNGEDWIYPASGFEGVGRVLGRRVRCLTAEVQMLSHTGYEPGANHAHDVTALSRRFGIPAPTE
jgi:lincosamide nucleotidyltransferase A/C/D/E